MNRNKLIAAAIVGELVLLCGLFSAITFTIEDPLTQLSLARATNQNAQDISGQALLEQLIENMQVPASNPNFCQGYTDDRQYLYNLNTVITTKLDGTKTFTSTRASDGKVLRQRFDNERFFTDRSNNRLTTTYDIIEQCGGVDIVYTVRNASPTGLPGALPELRVDGIDQRTTGNFYVLDTKDSGYMVNTKNSSSNNPPDALYGGGGVNYPGFYYSPVMVAHDTDFAVGSALIYPYMQYRHTVGPLLTKVTTGEQSGTWRHEYKELEVEMAGNGNNPPPAELSSGEVHTYTVSLRFTEPRSWILTLKPYKDFFKATYGNVDQVRPVNLAPVEVFTLADTAYETVSNPRGFANLSLMSQGWGAVLAPYITNTLNRSFNRTMIWAPSGLYTQYGPCPHCNYPSHFMSFLPHLTASAGEFSRFAQNNIELGFWWGNSSYIPVPNQWDPTERRIADFTSSSDRDFMESQLLLAYQRGARTIGLDAFDGTVFDKSAWIDHMKQLTNNQILFVHETSGPDILHRKIANFYHPTSYRWWTQYNKLITYGPDVLSRYLNDGAEIWLQHDVDSRIHPFCSRPLYEEAYSWGFTSVIGQCAGLNIDQLDFEVVECFDKIDNDGDGRVDWPYDTGCLSAASTQEGPAGDTGSMFEGIGIDSSGGSGGGGGDGSGNGGNDRNSSTGGRSGSSRNNDTSSRESLLRRIQELQALLNALQAQLSGGGTGTGAGTGSAVGNITRNLTIGSQGTDVTILQQYLVSKGVLVMPPGAAYGTFGPLTRNALARFQSIHGISPALGYFGPVTRDRMKNI